MALATINLKELHMLGPIARWAHNLLLAAMGMLTVAVIVLAR